MGEPLSTLVIKLTAPSVAEVVLIMWLLFHCCFSHSGVLGAWAVEALTGVGHDYDFGIGLLHLVLPWNCIEHGVGHCIGYRIGPLHWQAWWDRLLGFGVRLVYTDSGIGFFLRL
jgi:hypothetical protein